MPVHLGNVQSFTQSLQREQPFKKKYLPFFKFLQIAYAMYLHFPSWLPLEEKYGCAIAQLANSTLDFSEEACRCTEIKYSRII